MMLPAMDMSNSRSIGPVPKEAVMVGSKKYQLHLTQPSGDPVVNNLKLSDAIKKLKTGLQNLPQLVKDLETHPHRSLSIADAASDPQWFLVLDHNDEIAEEKLRLAAEVVPQPRGVGQPLSAIVEKMQLDEMTVADDKNFLNSIQSQKNLPVYIKEVLREMYK